MQWDALAFLPHPTDIALPPDHSPLFALIRWPGQAGLTSAVSVAAGSDGCLLGRIHFPCGYVVYVLLCCWGVFPVLTLYSPRSIVWGLFFSPHFPHVNAVFFFNSTCISLLIILVWLCMWRIIKNLEPWTLKSLISDNSNQNAATYSFITHWRVNWLKPRTRSSRSGSPITARSAIPCSQETCFFLSCHLVVPTGTVLIHPVLSCLVMSMETRLGQAALLVMGTEAIPSCLPLLLRKW